MRYNIIAADRSIGQIQVAYKDNDENVVGIYAIDVAVIDGKFLTGDALHQEILHRAPTWVSTREQEVRSATGFDEIEALVQELPAPKVDQEAEANSRMWDQFRYEQRLAEMLVKFGLLESDPTFIPVGKL